MYRTILFLSSFLFVLVIYSCTKDADDQTIPQNFDIGVNSTIDLDQPIYFDETVTFSIDLTTPEERSISSLQIVKNNEDIILSRDNLEGSSLKYTWDYETIEDDIASFVELEFIITDDLDDTKNVKNGIMVVEEFEFLFDNLLIENAWDFKNNLSVENNTNINADISVQSETISCGVGCLRYKHTISSHNNCLFYSFPLVYELSPDDRSLRQSTILEAIQNASAQTEMVVFSSFDEDLNENNQSFYGLPIIIQIRNSGEFATMELIDQSGVWRYRKRTEFSGI